MINLFNINNYNIDTSHFSNLLHDNVVTDFEDEFADYVGARYACSANSASSLIFLSLMQYSPREVRIPSTMPIVVPNAITNTNHKIVFYDDVKWVGHYYRLHNNVFDSAQEVSRRMYKNLAVDNAAMIFSFYPTKPVGGCDGGMVVSDDKEIIDYFRMMTMNGTTRNIDSWGRTQRIAGYKMHMNSIQAAIARENLRKLDHKNNILEEIKNYYNSVFSLQNTSNHLYRIRVNDNKKFISSMKDRGVQCGIHYEHCHNKRYFNCEKQSLPLSEKESRQTVSIPFHEKLTTENIRKVIESVYKASKECRS